MTVLQRQPGRTVTLEPGGSVVRKIFHGHDPDQLGRLAAREFDRMDTFHRVLRDLGGATCPRPLEVNFGLEPYIRMERAAGIPLQDDLAESDWELERIVEVAETLRQALIRYVVTFREPYWDFILRNMFCDYAAGVVTFLDFGIPVIYEPILSDLERASPLDVSLGSLVASSVFESARPKRLARRREHRQAQALAAAVVERCLAGDEGLELSGEGVRRVAHLTYRAAAAGGGWMRHGWYHGVGRLVAGPNDVDRLCIRPDAATGRRADGHGTSTRSPPPPTEQ